MKDGRQKESKNRNKESCDTKAKLATNTNNSTTTNVLRKSGQQNAISHGGKAAYAITEKSPLLSPIKTEAHTGKNFSRYNEIILYFNY